MKLKLSGSATVAAVLFITSGTLAATLGVRQIDRFNSEPSWVTSSELSIGQIITRNTLTQSRVDSDTAAYAIQDPRQIIGKQLLVAKSIGDTIAPGDLIAPAQQPLSELIPPGRVLYTLTPKLDGIPYSQLHGGDRLDILVLGRNGVRTAALDARLIGIRQANASSASVSQGGAMSFLKNKASVDVNPGEDLTLVVAVRPGDVYPLASIGSKETTSVVLHSSHDVASGNAQSINPQDRYHEVEMVSGLQRSKVRLLR